jgi:hypothetical protein
MTDHKGTGGTLASSTVLRFGYFMKPITKR